MPELNLDFSKSLLGQTQVEVRDEQTSASKLDNSSSDLNTVLKKDIEYYGSIDAVSPKVIVLSNGKKVKLKPRKKEGSQKNARKSTSSLDADIAREMGVLVNMERLRRKLKIRQIVEAQEPDFSNRFVTKFGNDVSNSEGEPKRKKQRTVTFRSRMGNTMWTEKYRPQTFFDLLGNERTNRRILSWLNQWNEVVFKRPTPDMMIPEFMALNEQHGEPRSGQGRSNLQNGDGEENRDPFNRPYHKIMLIYGPPGTGKTSIAHVIANQLGYEVSEINASDERAGAEVRARVRNGLQNRSLSGKPTCLIADEIDGASEQGFIRYLTSVLYRDEHATAQLRKGGTLDGAKNNKGGGKTRQILRRPMIAICNDAYASSLEKLRPLCEMVAFRRSNTRQIKTRLRNICSKEGLGTVDEKVLDAVVECSSGDLRSCINFFQFHGSSCLTTSSEQSTFENEAKGRDGITDDAMKDTQIAWYLLASEIFNRKGRTSKPAQRKKIQSFVLSLPHNQLQRVVSACFNAILECSSTGLKKLEETSRWLYFGDVVSRKCRAFTGRAEIGTYEGAVINEVFEKFNDVDVFSSARANDGGRLHFGTRDTFGDMKIQTRETMQRISKNPQLRLSVDELSILSSIVIPTGVLLQEFSSSADKVDHAVSVARKLGFHYETKSTRGKDGEFSNFHDKSHIMVPNLAVFLMSQSTVSKQEAVIQRLQRHYLRRREAQKALEERERKREAAEAARGIVSEKNSAVRGKALSSAEFFRKKYSEMSTKLSHGQEKGDAGTKKVARGLGMLAVIRKKSSGGNGNADGERKEKGVMSANANRIWIKYHEGFSNAVRKEITWSHLFG